MELQINEEIVKIKSEITCHISLIEDYMKKKVNFIKLSLKLHDSINTDIKLKINKEIEEVESVIQHLKKNLEAYQIKLDNFNEILLLL